MSTADSSRGDRFARLPIADDDSQPPPVAESQVPVATWPDRPDNDPRQEDPSSNVACIHEFRRIVPPDGGPATVVVREITRDQIAARWPRFVSGGGFAPAATEMTPAAEAPAATEMPTATGEPTNAVAVGTVVGGSGAGGSGVGGSGVGNSGKTGRPAALDIPKQREICAMLANGCSRAQAARYVGCSRRTILRTARRDPRFARALELAEVKSEVAQLDHVRSAGAHSWRAAAWLLERSAPERFSRKELYTRIQVLRVLRIICDDLIRSAAEPADTRRFQVRAGELIGDLDCPGGILRRIRDEEKVE